MAIEGSCHCGAVTVSIPTAPAVLTSCNCSICRRLGSLWAYFDPAEVTRTGATAVYTWGDRMLDLHRCTVCGCTVCWTPREGTAPDRMGVNVRLFAPEILAAARVRRVDGAADTWAELAD